jgi:large subunit ribosomal protein L25
VTNACLVIAPREMAEEILLKAQPRKVAGKQVRALRREGWIPVSLYGRHTQPANLQADARALQTVLGQAGHNRLVKLTVDGGESRFVIIREIQRESITRKLLHVDMQEIAMHEKMTTQVPLVLVGTSPVVQRSEGLLIHGLQEVTIRVLPGDLIPSIEVDVSQIAALNQGLYVRDLKVSDKIEILTQGEDMVAKVIPVKEEKIEEVVPAATAEVEVIGKGKKEEEGAEGEAAATPAAAKPEAKKEEKK